jgi:YihY family inner membrane protein
MKPQSAVPEAKRRVTAFDQWQQRRRWSAVPFAVVKKFSDDQSTSLASVIAFWAFFSIFPLLLVFVTVLAYVLPASTKGNVLKHVGSFLPLLNTSTVQTLSGSWWTLLLGLATSLWSGLAVVKALQAAFNSVWGVPITERPKFLEQIRRAGLVLMTIGAGLIVSTVISSYVTGTATGINLGWLGRLAGYVIAIALDVGLLVAAFRMLTHRDISTRDVVPGAIFSGVLFWILQQLSSLIISRHLQSAQGTYGTFATVITMLWWFYLQAQITVLGAQLNVVLKRGLWPRSLLPGPETSADYRIHEKEAEQLRYHEQQRVRSTTDER